jgi:hypothetical protein
LFVGELADWFNEIFDKSNAQEVNWVPVGHEHFLAVALAFKVNIVLCEVKINLPHVESKIKGICSCRLRAISPFNPDLQTILLHRRAQCDHDDQNENGHFEPIVGVLPNGSHQSKFTVKSAELASFDLIQLSSYLYDDW